MFNVQSTVFEEWLPAREIYGKERENALPKVFCLFLHNVFISVLLVIGGFWFSFCIFILVQLLFKQSVKVYSIKKKRIVKDSH